MKFLVYIIALVCIIRGCDLVFIESVICGAGLVEWLAWKLCACASVSGADERRASRQSQSDVLCGTLMLATGCGRSPRNPSDTARPLLQVFARHTYKYELTVDVSSD